MTTFISKFNTQCDIMIQTYIGLINMKILILGSGGREYSIARAISKEEDAHELFFMPGNGATSDLGTNINIKDYNLLADFAQENNIDLTIVGPEAPLVDGIVDIFKAKNLTIFWTFKRSS